MAQGSTESLRRSARRAVAGVAGTETRPRGERVLVVCTGNIVRSPLIASLFSSVIGVDDVEVPLRFDSAGTLARVGEAADPNSVEIARAYGVDLSGHRARQVDESVIAGATTILCAGRANKATVLGMAPQRLRDVFTVRELARVAPEAIPELTERGSVAARWRELVAYAATHRSRLSVDTADEDDIIDPYRRSPEVWWRCEESMLTAVVAVMKAAQVSDAV